MVFTNMPRIRRIDYSNLLRQLGSQGLDAELSRPQWPTGGRPGVPHGGRTPMLAQPVGPEQGVKACDAGARLTSLLRLALSHVL